jgi:membrane-bound serine protease (ClpP class)
MKLTLILTIVATLATLVVIVVFALSRHKKAGTGDIKLLGEIGLVDSQLEPEGTVLVRGELWRAKSEDGVVIPAQARVRIVGFQDHLVLVEPVRPQDLRCEDINRRITWLIGFLHLLEAV